MKAPVLVRSVGAAAVLAAAACNGDPAAPLGGGAGTGPEGCSIPQSQIFNGGPGKDGIPALTNPEMVRENGQGLEYLFDDDRVVGVVLGGQPVAIPLNIFWWHEVVNLDMNGESVVITHCPLTGSSLGFDREQVGGAEFGVSGLLFQNNLIMYDRNNPESLWPQMLRGARCGSRDGQGLVSVPVVEMTWGGWRSLQPATLVVSANTGFQRDYRRYPYGSYDTIDNSQLLFPGVELDSRRPPKERVLGIPVGGDGGIALPYGSLGDRGEVAAVGVMAGGRGAVVLWDGTRGGAVAFWADPDGSGLTFRVEGRRIFDNETDSEWRLDGGAIAGPLQGSALEPVAEAYVAYWFAWAAFHPQTELWG